MSQILVVDAGGQYCHLISRRVRDAGVQAKICTPETVTENLADARGVIISGGPSSVYDAASPHLPRSIFQSDLPILGICYGHQLMAHALGGVVEPAAKREFGEARLNIVAKDTILRGLDTNQIVWMSHGDEVKSPPPGFAVLAQTESCPVAVMANVESRLFGIQFHPEVSHTHAGNKIIENFLFDVCHCAKDWDPSQLLSQLEKQIREQVRSRNVLFFVSGGVDSTVAFTLCTSALGPDRVLGVFVDTGFMRKGERLQIEEAFQLKGWHNIKYVDAVDRFLASVGTETDPEEKRHRIGDSFLDVQTQIASELGLSSDQWMLGQGTIYPDTIESGGSKAAAKIKTHHNRVPAIEKLIERGLLLEPLTAFYKDEVRDIGRALGLPEAMVAKHPFPGPGLAVRCLCSKDRFAVEMPERLQQIARTIGLEAWSVPLQTVGVQGDYRSYSKLVILSGRADLKTFGDAATRITGELPGTNRVAFLVEPGGRGLLKNAEVRPGDLSRPRLDLLREADAIAQEMLRDEGFFEEVWQFPVILLPLTIEGGETVALRPVSSTDGMTASYSDLPMDFIKTLGRKIRNLNGVDAVLYDVTNKPPATIEWE